MLERWRWEWKKDHINMAKINLVLDKDINTVNKKSVSVWWCFYVLSNTEAQFIKKLTNTEAELKKYVAYKKCAVDHEKMKAENEKWTVKNFRKLLLKGVTETLCPKKFKQGEDQVKFVKASTEGTESDMIVIGENVVMQTVLVSMKDGRKSYRTISLT